jgi:formylglycine-generating enzyme required for sulfatase activity
MCVVVDCARPGHTINYDAHLLFPQEGRIMAIEQLPTFIAIPAQPFLMGSLEQQLGDLARRYGGMRESYREESPQHEVRGTGFAIARIPVTNALYAGYVAATSAAPPLHWRGTTPPIERLAHPVVDVSWEDARNFCSWLNSNEPGAAQLREAAGPTLGHGHFRLPTEAEWEQAARGNDGRWFPWGQEFVVEYANTRESGYGGTTTVGTFPAGASPYGILDMAGNIWEWTSSLDRPYPYQADDGREDEHASGRRILRGGCYANPQGFARCACRFRLAPALRNEFIGFRLAYTKESGK